MYKKNAKLSPSYHFLGFFKYFHFFTGGHFDALTIILPVGISFYTFQSISYVVDIYRGKLANPESFLKVSLYISFFPQLMAGPVVRAKDFFPQLNTNPDITWDNIQKGAQVFSWAPSKRPSSLTVWQSVWTLFLLPLWHIVVHLSCALS